MTKDMKKKPKDLLKKSTFNPQNPLVPNPKKKRAARKVTKDQKNPEPNFLGQLGFTVVILIIVALIFSSFFNGEEIDEISLSEVAQKIQEGSIEVITVRGDSLEVLLVAGDEAQESEVLVETEDLKSDMSDATEVNEEEVIGMTEENLEGGGQDPEVISEAIAITYENAPLERRRLARKEGGAALSETLSNYGVTSAELKSVKIEVKDPTGFGYWLGILAPFMIPLIFIIFLIWFLTRQVKGAGGAMNFGQSKPQFITPDDEENKVTFKDVAGVKEAKAELEEIVDFLKNPKKYLEIGARIPKGVLLTGAPGTGKTLLARAVAGEAGVNFFSISGSEFIEMFVGVGASRVRDLFKLAKAAAPSIIFIDEIDAVGRSRGSGTGGGNDEREQTLNQILVEMDGFAQNEKVIIMAATNRDDVLDPAILRPGRFDRRVVVELPDRQDRTQILVVHSKNKPLDQDVMLSEIAKRTPGFSGADLYSLMNEAAILAAREEKPKILQDHLLRSIEKVMMGPERKSHLFSEDEKRKTAYHEAGHALVASLLEHADPVHKISIISRGRAGGYTLKLPDDERRLPTKKQFVADIAMTLGGYVTEELIYDDLSTGPSNDLQQATSLVRDMITRYGMSPEFGPIALKSDGGRTLFGRGVGDKEYSESVGSQIDEEIRRFLAEGYATAQRIVTKHRDVLEAITDSLMENEVLEREQYEEILKEHNIPVKAKPDDVSEGIVITG